MTNPPTCKCCLEEPAITGEPAYLCATCYACAAGGVDPDEAEGLYLDGAYATPLEAFESLVITAVDAAINGDATLDGRRYVAGVGYPGPVAL